MKELEGKTILKVEAGLFDHHGDGNSVSQVFKITCSDEEILYFICDGGDSNFYSICDFADPEQYNNFENMMKPFDEVIPQHMKI